MMHTAHQLRTMPHADLCALANLAKGPVASGHATFDKAANHRVHGYVGTGNVESNVQASSFIRPWTETECNGHSFPPGHLHDTDIAQFARLLSSADRAKIDALTRDRPAIAYVFFHYVGRRRVMHGWIVTDAYYRFIAHRVTGPTVKSHAVLDDMRRRISWTDTGPRLLN